MTAMLMPVDAWAEGEEFVVEFELPGINTDSGNNAANQRS